jgi:4'-phosphopantetheinyl transferase
LANSVKPDPHAEVDVWVLELDGGPSADAGAILDSSERERAARFAVAEARRRFELRRTKLRRVLAGYLGIGPAEVVIDRTCLRCGDPTHGKPRLPGGSLEFSTAATGDLAVVAVASGVTLGVDVEAVGAVDAALAGRLPDSLLTEGERKALAERVLTAETLWLRKEALSKAIGTGLVADVATLDTQDATGDWHFCDLPQIPGCRGALAANRPIGSVRFRRA